jgi:hypothetical protein
VIRGRELADDYMKDENDYLGELDEEIAAGTVNRPMFSRRLRAHLVLRRCSSGNSASDDPLQPGRIGVRERFHIGIVTLPEMLGPEARRAFDGFTDLILLLFGIGMTWWSLELVMRTWNRLIPMIGLPVGTKYLALVVCGVLIVLFTLERLIFLAAYKLERDVEEEIRWD